jgi:hypothetical protein
MMLAVVAADVATGKISRPGPAESVGPARDRPATGPPEGRRTEVQTRIMPPAKSPGGMMANRDRSRSLGRHCRMGRRGDTQADEPEERPGRAGDDGAVLPINIDRA